MESSDEDKREGETQGQSEGAIQDHTRPSGIKLTAIERWLVAAVVAGVAIHQFVATASSTLSPWKGGGFGMFAVTDSPGTRFVRAEGITSDGRRIRIDGLEGLEREVRRRWRSRPLNEQLKSLADELIEREFVRTNLRSVSAIHQLQREVPILGETLKLDDGGRAKMHFYRTRREDDPVPEEKSGEKSGSILRLEAIELQWWKIEFDSEGRKLRPLPLFAPVRRGKWTAQDQPSANPHGAVTDGSGVVSVEGQHPAQRDRRLSTSPSPGGR